MSYKRTADGRWVLEGAAKPSARPQPPPPKKEPRPDRAPAPIAREVPNDIEVEQAILGAMMVEGQAISVARQFLTPAQFYHEHNRLIFKAICAIQDRGGTADVVMTASELRAKNLLGAIGGSEYLSGCLDRVITAANAGHYAKRVAALHLDREIIRACGDMAKAASAEVLDRLRQLHLEREAIDSPVMYDYRINLKGVLEEILKPENAKRYQTYYPTIDGAWHGIKGGEVNVWGGATNEGKSLLLLNLLHRSAEHGIECLYVGTEMKAIETVERHLSIQSNVEAWKIRKPQIEGADKARLRDAISLMTKLNISILDDPEPNLAKIESAIHSSKAEVIFLDYLERFEMPRADALRLQIKEFMRKLKTMARRTNTVIHLAAQLNRDTYGAEQRPPTLADLSESSAIEKEADRVGLLWTPPDPQKTKPGDKRSSEMGEHCRVVQIINAKSRHCPKGFTFDFVLNSISLKIQEIGEYRDPFNNKL